MRLGSLIIASSLAAISSASFSLTYHYTNDCTGNSPSNEEPAGAQTCTAFATGPDLYYYGSVYIESDSSDLSLAYYDAEGCGDLAAEGTVTSSYCLAFDGYSYYYTITNA